MTQRTAASLLIALALSQSGCVALAPLATVAVVKSYENAVGHRLDPTPAPVTAAGAAGQAVGQNAAGGAASAEGASAADGAVATPDPAPAAPVVDTKTVTLNKFNQVQAGMTYQDVVKIFGREGQLLPARATVIYVWYNDNGSIARVIFSAQRVADKQQERLG